MPRRLDHLVICVHDLAQAALDWQTLGFTLTPTGVHPFGTSNRLAMFGNNFLELLAVTNVAAVPPAAPGHFSFAAHNQDFLRSSEGMSMLALHSTNSHAEAARFNAANIGAYAPFDFGRDAVLPGGGVARVGFSLAFATDPAMPGIAFFTCQQRHPPELFWKAEYQHHPNGALRVIDCGHATSRGGIALRGLLRYASRSPGVIGATPPWWWQGSEARDSRQRHVQRSRAPRRSRQ
jgi:hypothetical protein